MTAGHVRAPRQRRLSSAILAVLVSAVGVGTAASQPRPASPLMVAPGGVDGLVQRAISIRPTTRTAEEYAAAVAAYDAVLADARRVDRARLSLDEQVDLDLLISQVTTRRWEIADVALHTVDPTGYIALGQTSGLFLRPAATGEAGIRRGVAEMRRLPTLLAQARRNLTAPARTWTENALVQVRYARLLLTEYVPRLVTNDADLRAELSAAARDALAAVDAYGAWLERDLLPRSTRPPVWRPADIEVYQFTHEQLDAYSVDEMIRIASDEARQLTTEMQALAVQIHPSGDLRRVWDVMKEEAPPWPQVVPMAQRYA